MKGFSTSRAQLLDILILNLPKPEIKEVKYDIYVHTNKIVRNLHPLFMPPKPPGRIEHSKLLFFSFQQYLTV